MRLQSGALALLLALGLYSVAPAHAQVASILPACATQSLVTGNSQLTMDTTGALCVNATVTASTSATAAATPPAVSAGTGKPLVINLFSALFTQPTFGGTPVDGTHGLPVNCIVGCAGGSFNNNADGVATSATNGQTAAWLYAWNGATFDRLEDDASKNLKVTITAASGSIASGAFASGALAAGSGTDGWDVTEGTKADTAYVSGNGSVVSLLKGIFGNTGASLPSGTATIGNVNGAPNATPTDCSGTISSGGAAQNALTAQTTLHGFTIANIDASAGSGEPLWISFTTTAAAATAASYPLAAPTATTFANLSSFTTPVGFGLNHALSIIGATTGHKFSCTWW